MESLLFVVSLHHNNTCPPHTRTPDGTLRPATTGPAIFASCDGSRLDSLVFKSPMDWMQRRVYLRETPFQDRPVCRTPSAVHLRLNNSVSPIRFTPIGDGNGGKSSQLYVDSERRYVFKLLLKRNQAYHGHAAIERDVCFSQRLTGLAWAPKVICHSPIAMVSAFAGRPLTPADVARRPTEYASQVTQPRGASFHLIPPHPIISSVLFSPLRA